MDERQKVDSTQKKYLALASYFTQRGKSNESNY
jgi:hypothetical protein